MLTWRMFFFLCLAGEVHSERVIYECIADNFWNECGIGLGGTGAGRVSGDGDCVEGRKMDCESDDGPIATSRRSGGCVVVLFAALVSTAVGGEEVNSIV